jgi:hypothetical protein
MHKHEEHQRGRFAGEIILPAVKKRGRRPGRPERAIPWGSIPTSAANDAQLPDTYRIQRATSWGAWYDLPVPRRKRGEVRASTPPAVDGESARIIRREALPMDELFAARMAIERALTRGFLDVAGVRWRLFPTSTGRIRSVPDKGPVLTWASSADLADALARGIL